jgi:hypothetical protein
LDRGRNENSSKNTPAFTIMQGNDTQPAVVAARGGSLRNDDRALSSPCATHPQARLTIPRAAANRRFKESESGDAAHHAGPARNLPKIQSVSSNQGGVGFPSWVRPNPNTAAAMKQRRVAVKCPTATTAGIIHLRMPRVLLTNPKTGPRTHPSTPASTE